MVKKEKKQLRDNEETYSAKPWPDLPQPICDKISREANLLNKICSKGATKSWATKSSKCKSSNSSSSSWLQLLELDNGSHVGHDEADSFSIRVENTARDWTWDYRCDYGGVIRKWVPREKPCCQLRCLGWSHGFLVAKPIPRDEYDYQARFYDLWYPSKYSPGYWRRMHLPKANRHKWLFSGIFLSSDVDYPDEDECIALGVTGTTSPAFASYRLADRLVYGKNDWTDCGNIVDPHCSNPYETEHFMRITNAIGFRGKFYAVSLQGTLVVIEDKDGVVGITRMCNRRVVPSVSSKHYREFQVESEGKVLLVFLISRNSVETVDDVEVYEIINDGDLELSKCENLGDTALFLGANCCMAFSGKRVGCNGNCIYFSHCSVDDWSVYDLKANTISPIDWNQPKQLV